MKSWIHIVLILFLGLRVQAQESNEFLLPIDDWDVSESGSTSMSNSGNLYIIDENGRKEKQYYYVYVYQYAYIRNGEVDNENHNFNFNGYLEEGGDLELIGKVPGVPYLLYENDLFSLQVPYTDRGEVYFKQRSRGPWQCLTNDNKAVFTSNSTQDEFKIDDVTESGSMSQSNSGYLLFKKENGERVKEYFYIYAYQYAYIRNGSVDNENHNFNFNGILDKGGALNLIGKVEHEPYLLYENDLFRLKIPYTDSGRIFFQQKGRLQLWQCISD